MSDSAGLPDNVVRLIVGGKEGKLTTPAGEHVPVRVFERGGDQLVLVLMLDADEELQAGPTKPLSLEYVSTQGLVRFSGEAVLEGRDLVRFTVAAAGEVVQRREHVRVEAVQPVVLAAGVNGEPVNTHAIDVSGGGMLLTGADTLTLDSTVRFSLHLGAHMPPIEGLAHVVRNDDQGRRGLVFDDISSTDRQRLIHFVFERQRVALAKTKPTTGNAAVQSLPSRRANPS
jgi:PilZ domain